MSDQPVARSPPVYRTAQHRKTWTNINALCGIQIHGPSVQAYKAQASDCTATVTGTALPNLQCN